jgi:2-polyprenyl-3-methyl-5-hydroxy-6-metoxy-1,4-benzoquinol methylase
MASMNQREKGLARLRSLRVDAAQPYVLHYRGLFSYLKKASFHAHGRLLDIGCGNKPFEKMFKDRVSEHIGCDAVQSSEARADVICPATQLPFESESYGTVSFSQVVEHVADRQAMLREPFECSSATEC